MKLVNVGFGNMVSSDKLVAIVGHQSAPVKRMIQEARDSGYLIDATYGRKTRAVIIMDSGHILAIPSLEANHVDAMLVHEAAIGKIAGDQLVKLMTLVLTEQQAEEQIINGFLQ